MKGFRFYAPGRGEVKELMLRPIKANEVLLKVQYCGVCGTDLNIWRGTDRSASDIVLGHEYCGTIVEAGSAVQRVAVGQRVAVDPNVPCYQCEACRKGRINLCAQLTALGVDIDGGFAEYCIVPDTQLFPLPPNMLWEEAAMVEPVACALNGINRCDLAIGDDVLILGGGPMGLIMLQLAKLRGAGSVTLCERMEGRRQLGEQLGADRTVSGLAELEAADTPAPDVVIECIGNPVTQEAAFRLVKPGGMVELFGDGDMTSRYSLPSQLFYQKELTARGAALNPFTHQQAFRAIASGRIRLLPLVSRKIPVDELPALLKAGFSKDDIKILVDFSE